MWGRYPLKIPFSFCSLIPSPFPYSKSELTELGILKRKQEIKKERKHALDQESDQEEKITITIIDDNGQEKKKTRSHCVNLSEEQPPTHEEMAKTFVRKLIGQTQRGEWEQASDTLKVQAQSNSLSNRLIVYLLLNQFSREFEFYDNIYQHLSLTT